MNTSLHRKKVGSIKVSTISFEIIGLILSEYLLDREH